MASSRPRNSSRSGRGTRGARLAGRGSAARVEQPVEQPHLEEIQGKIEDQVQMSLQIRHFSTEWPTQDDVERYRQVHLCDLMPAELLRMHYNFTAALRDTHTDDPPESEADAYRAFLAAPNGPADLTEVSRRISSLLPQVSHILPDGVNFRVLSWPDHLSSEEIALLRPCNPTSEALVDSVANTCAMMRVARVFALQQQAHLTAEGKHRMLSDPYAGNDLISPPLVLADQGLRIPFTKEVLTVDSQVRILGDRHYYFCSYTDPESMGVYLTIYHERDLYEAGWTYEELLAVVEAQRDAGDGGTEKPRPPPEPQPAHGPAVEAGPPDDGSMWSLPQQLQHRQHQRQRRAR